MERRSPEETDAHRRRQRRRAQGEWSCFVDEEDVVGRNIGADPSGSIWQRVASVGGGATAM
jgi:hypothetical protein